MAEQSGEAGTAAGGSPAADRAAQPGSNGHGVTKFVNESKEMVKAFLREVGDKALPISVLAIGSLFCILFFMAIWQPERIIAPLADTTYARGLITFLVALVTVAIALIMTFYSVLSNRDDKTFEPRFNNAKEILTILIGVLGTVIGFYFGSATEPVVASLRSSAAQLSTLQPKNGETITLTSFVTGGTPPYIYAISAEPDTLLAPMAPGSSPDGLIVYTIPISTTIDGETDVALNLKVWDSAGQMVTVGETNLTIVP